MSRVQLECKTCKSPCGATPESPAPGEHASAALGEDDIARRGDKAWSFSVGGSVGDMSISHLASPPPMHPVVFAQEKHPADAVGSCLPEAQDSHEEHAQRHALIVFRCEEWVDPLGSEAGQGESFGRKRRVYLEIERIRLHYSVPFLQAVVPCVQALVFLREAYSTQRLRSGEGWQTQLFITLAAFLSGGAKGEGGQAKQGSRAGEAGDLASGDASQLCMRDTPLRRALRALAPHCGSGTTLKMDLRVELPDLVVPSASLTRDRSSSILVLRGGSLVGRSVAAGTSPSKQGEASAHATVSGAGGLRHKVAIDGTCLLCCTKGDDWSSGLRRDL